MTYENFLKVILEQKKLDEQISKAYELNIDLIDFTDGYHQIITTLLKEVYGEEGYDWYSWFCYDNKYGQDTLTATDKDGNPICYSYESLYEYLEANCKPKLEEPEVKEEKIVDSLSLEDLMNLMISDITQVPYSYFKKNKKEVMEKDEYVSIFEHQRTAAGRELGKQVATVAQKLGIRPISKLVDTKTYQGPILTYPRSFLDNYFSTK